ncbi:MAG: flagellin [Desulfobacter sp.]|nr:MAG: flagellin [Desulfobacter sp.]
MALNITGNSAALIALGQAGKANSALTNTLERIATGKRINSASDDASAMAIADRLKSQSLAAEQQIENANASIAIAQVADGALGQMSDILQDIRTKTIAAGNGAQSAESLAAIQSEINGSLGALNDIVSNTSYNGQTLLDGSFSTAGLSIGSAAPSQLGSGETGMLSNIDITTAEGAQNALGTVDQALTQLNRIRSDVGSSQNQSLSEIEVLSTSRVNLISAESQIRDSDLAEESIELSRNQLLRQAATYALNHANDSTQQIVDLLG